MLTKRLNFFTITVDVVNLCYCYFFSFLSGSNTIGRDRDSRDKVVAKLVDTEQWKLAKTYFKQ